MDETTRNLLVALAVPAIGAVTFVAYKHPAAFKKLALVLQTLCWGAMLGILLWNSSNSMAKNAALHAVNYSMSPDEHKIEDSIDAESVSFWWYWVFMVANVYVGILLSLPSWLLDQKPIDDDKH
jgi:hypothetical protein